MSLYPKFIFLYKRLSLLKKGQLVAGNTKAWLRTNSVKEISFSDHTHSGYALSSHTHSNYMTRSQVQSMIDDAIESGGGGGSNNVTLKINGDDFTAQTSRGGFKYTINLASYCGFSPAIVKALYSSFNIEAYDDDRGKTYTMIFRGSSDISIPQKVIASNGNDYTIIAMHTTTFYPNSSGKVALVLVLAHWSTTNNLTVLVQPSMCKVAGSTITSVDLYGASIYLDYVTGSLSFGISG